MFKMKLRKEYEIVDGVKRTYVAYYPKEELGSAEIGELAKMFIGMPQHIKGVLGNTSPMIAFHSEHITFVEIKQNFVDDEIC